MPLRFLVFPAVMLLAACFDGQEPDDALATREGRAEAIVAATALESRCGFVMNRMALITVLGVEGGLSGGSHFDEFEALGAEIQPHILKFDEQSKAQQSDVCERVEGDARRLGLFG